MLEVQVVLGFRRFPRYFVRTENLTAPSAVALHAPLHHSRVGIEKCRWMLCTPALMSCGAAMRYGRAGQKMADVSPRIFEEPVVDTCSCV